MFQTTLQHKQSKLPSTPSTCLTYSSTSTCSDLDLQYELYSRYMQMSKQQIAIQELLLMKDSQALLESINLGGKADTSRDAHSTMDSMCCDEDFDTSLVHDRSLVHEFSVIQKRSPKKIIRKSTRQSILKPTGRINDDFAEILNEIQRNCSENTFTKVDSLIQEHKKNLNRMMDVQKKQLCVEKKQKNLRRMEEKSEKIEQENAIFRVKLGEMEEKIRAKEDEIRALKERLSQLRTTEKQNMSSQKRLLLSPSTNINTNNKPIAQDHPQLPSAHSYPNPNPSLSQYLLQKQSRLTQRLTQIQLIQKRIQNLIQTAVLSPVNATNSDPYSCNKCCTMIKKVKESVIMYRHYLQEEADQSQRLYNMLKAQLENCVLQKKLQPHNI